MSDIPATNLTMLTLVKAEGELEVSLAKLPMPEPKPHEVLVKVFAAPINPSDLGLLVGAADVATLRGSSRDGLPVVTADVSPAGLAFMAGRVGEAMPIGNEGCGVVVSAGSAPEAQALMGKTVAVLGGALFAEYRCLPAQMCMELPDGTDPRDGASCFVNPLTALCFPEVMRDGGYKALIHVAAASNLGQMLVKICKADGIPLINIVRNEAQATLLKGIGATHVLDSTHADFQAQLTDAIAETEAFCAFDPVGGGKMASHILNAMEAAAVRSAGAYSRYGSDQMKQVYIYGALDVGPTILNRSFGLSWSVSGFLLTPYMAKLGMEKMGKMRARVVSELKTTFASSYSHEISLEEALDPAVLQAYNAKRTGEKYLICPHKAG